MQFLVAKTFVGFKAFNRNILGTKNLHEILSDRESISNSMQVSHTHKNKVRWLGKTNNCAFSGRTTQGGRGVKPPEPPQKEEENSSKKKEKYIYIQIVS